MILKHYDIALDEVRETTQADLDQMRDCVAAFGLWRDATRGLMELTLAVAQGKVTVWEAAQRLRKAGIYE